MKILNNIIRQSGQLHKVWVSNININGVFSNKCNFQWTDLSNNLFIENNFTNATVTGEQFANAKSLQGSILPNGTVVSMMIDILIILLRFSDTELFISSRNT